MDELILQLKIEANTAAIEDLQKQFEKLKTSTKETSEGFTLADTSMGKMWNTLTTGVEKGVASLKTLTGALAATGIGLLVIAVAALYNWFQKTEEGSNTLKKIMAELGVVMRDGPLFVLNALKIPLDVIVGYFKVLYSVITNMIGVITGKVGLAEAIKNVSASFKEQAEHVKQDVENLKDLAATEKQRAIDTAKLADLQAAQIKQERLDKVALAILNEDAMKSREKAAQAGVTLTQKEALFNKAKDDQNKIYEINHTAALKSIEIAQLAITAGDKSGKALDDLAAANAHLTDVETARDAAMMRIDRRSTATSNAILKQKQEEAKTIAELDEKTLEDKLKGRDKELAAENFSYSQKKIQYKNSAKELEALEKEHAATMIEINQKFDAEQAKKDNENAKAKYEAEKQQWNDIEKQEKDHAKVLEKINSDDFKLKRIDEATYLNNKLMLLKAEGMNEIEAEAQIAEEKKKIDADLEKSKIDSIKRTFEALSSITTKNTILGKAIAVGQAIINTYQGASLALATVPPPFSFIEAGATIAAGLVDVAKISGAKFAAGGMISGSQYSGDHIPIMANSGEFMVNNKAMQNPQIASAVMAFNANPNGNVQGNSQLTEERVAEIVAQGVKSVPVIASQYRTNWSDERVKQRQGHFQV